MLILQMRPWKKPRPAQSRLTLQPTHSSLMFLENKINNHHQNYHHHKTDHDLHNDHPHSYTSPLHDSCTRLPHHCSPIHYLLSCSLKSSPQIQENAFFFS